MLANPSQTQPRGVDLEPWEIRCAAGPVVAAAIHAGHDVRSELTPYLALTPTERLQEEDPFTDFWMTIGDTTIRVNRSRFEVDLNRPETLAVYTDPQDSWGLGVWREAPPETELERSRTLHRQFYGDVQRVLGQVIERHGAVLVLDLHSYNHRRRGPDSVPEDQSGNPDIDLGVTTLDHDRFGPLLERFTTCLRQPSGEDWELDVRHNVRYPNAGYFPAWVFRTWGSQACVISVEVKKIFMDEWTGAIDIAMGHRLRSLLARAVVGARDELRRC